MCSVFYGVTNSRSNIYRCWQCGDEGQDNVMGGVFRCSGNMCGRFYHRHCVELNTNSLIKADLDEVQRCGLPSGSVIKACVCVLSCLRAERYQPESVIPIKKSLPSGQRFLRKAMDLPYF